MRRSSALVALVVLASLQAVACSAPTKGAASRAPFVARAAEPPAPALLGPARWIYTDRIGALFDQASPVPTLPGSEPVILDGVRALVTNGIVDGWARTDERIVGFRRLPERFGGGYAIWSDARTYRAETFLGELTALAGVGATGGVRPWMGSLLLRTSVGILVVEPGSHALSRADVPGMSDAAALDDRRAVRLDLLGRATFTVDGGASWTDVLASRGALVSGLDEVADGGITLGTPARSPTSLLFDREGHLGDPSPRPRLPASPGQLGAGLLAVLPSSSRALPSEAIAHAAAFGARLPGDRLLVAREGGLQILSGLTALPLDDADLVDVDEKLARCQPITLGATAVLLACAGERGAEVLSLPDTLGRPRLEATFPEQGLFVAGPRDRLGFVGRCGPLPPSSGDLGPASARPGEMTDDEQAGLSPPSPSSPELESRVLPSLVDEARYCARISADRWVERRLGGDDARSLYRFVPGDEGRITALVLAGAEAEGKEPLLPRKGSSVGEGVRVIHLDPDDPALGGAAFPAVPVPPTEAPYHAIDADYWEDDDGAIRGWVSLPAPGEAFSPPPSPQGPARRRLRVAPGRGGRSAGLRVDRDGHVQVLPLPDGVGEVVTGGRFGLAQAMKDGVATTWETVDGGRTWAVIAGPPIGKLESPFDAGAPFGCSAIGCTWGSGVVRLGWGGPPPPAAREASRPAGPEVPVIRGPQPVKVACSTDAEGAAWASGPATSVRGKPASAKPASARPAPAKAPPTRRSSAVAATPPPSIPISLRLGTSAAIGQLGAAGSWTGEVWSPFQPAAPTRHLSAVDRSLNTVQGAVIPILDASPRAPVDLLLSVGKRRLRLGAASPAFLPFDLAAKITIAADGPDGELVALDADKGILWIARGEAVSAALRLSRIADVSRTRFTLGRRIEGGGLVLVGYSIGTGEVFAGDLDLARAEVGPLAPLGRIETLTERGAAACGGQKGAIRFLADLLVDLTIAGKGSVPLHDQQGLATFLIEASPTRLCAAGMEVGFPRGKAADLTVRFGPGGGAAVRTPGPTFKGTCALGAASR